MTIVVHCRDVGFDCDGVVRAETEEQAMQMVAAHARDVHSLQEISPEIAAKVKSVMKTEESAA